MKKLLYIFLLFTGFANAQIVTIPDANFKAKLIALGVDTNSDGNIQQSEALAVTDINVMDSNISDLTGIEAFSNLLYFICDNNQITTPLNFSGNTMLTILSCQNNLIPSIDISGCTALTIFSASSNFQLQTLNASNCINLSGYLDCVPHQTLNINNCPLLTQIWCNGISAIDISGCISLNNIHIEYAQFTSLDVSGLSNLQTLVVNYSQLNSVNVLGCNNLVYLDFYDCNLSTLDLSGLSNLQALHIELNDLTSLNLSGCSSLPLINEWVFGEVPYTLTSLNISGCQSLTNLNCINTQLTSLDASNLISLTHLNCNYSLLNNLNVNGCINLSKLSFAATQITSIDLSVLPALTELMTIDSQLTTLDVSANSNLTSLNCSSSPALETLFLKNGQNETVDLSGNDNLTYVCADESQVAAIQAIALPTTVVNSYCTFTPGGNYNTISGTVFFDVDNNGCQVSESLNSYNKIKINDGTNDFYVFVNPQGNYIFNVLAGNYTVTTNFENPNFYSVSPLNSNVTFLDNNNNIFVQDFCIAADLAHPDVEVVIAPTTPARPGFDAKYKITYRNKGNQTLSGDVIFTYNDSVLDYVAATVTPTSQNTGIINWNYTDLLPLQSRSFEVTLNVNSPTETPPVNIGDQLDFNAIVNPITGDDIPSDNQFAYKQTVVGSYDPNNIECLEGNVVPPSEIGNYLHYIINFENTGTSQAENIVVKTTIDETKFDVNSLQMLNTSHNAYIKQTGNVVEFIFENIALDTGGHGNVLLKIKSKNDLVTGDAVSKRADIFFDYNAPIDTGLVNTIFQSLSTPDFPDNSIGISPNPTSSIINIKSDFNIKSVQLYDVQGRLLQTQLVDEVQTSINISEKIKRHLFLKSHFG